jgi:RNA polymerase sigma-70 factor (ECF subfamily)
MDHPEEWDELSPDEAFTWFFRGEYPSVVRTVAVILQDRDLARDIAQEAFIELMTHWNSVSRYERPEAWVRRVAIRLAMRTRRRDVMRLTRERLADAAHQGVGPASPADALDLMAAVRRLSPAQRAAVALFYYEDRPVSEVADILACTQSTAKVHLHKARQRLASLLGEVSSDAG